MSAFLRMGEPNVLTVTPTPQSVIATVPSNANSARVVNPNKFNIRFRGSDGPTDLVTATTGVLLLAGASEVFSTQSPSKPYLTAMSVDSAITGTAAATGNFELQFGTGL